ncbi:MAG: FHA domain-containing protein [Thermoguttaceae bacterium]
MEVKLVCVGGKHPGKEIPVRGPKYFIGRAEDCHLRPGSQEVSRHHAVILLEEGFVAVRDFGSRNGTFVNEEQVRGERELRSGDRLRIGPLDFEVQLSVAVGGKKKPKVTSVREAASRSAAPVAAADDDEMDVSAWFGEDDAPPAADSKAETRAGASADSTAVMSSKKPEGSSEEESEQPKKKFKLTAPAMGPHVPKSVNSEDAAADVLRKMMGH